MTSPFCPTFSATRITSATWTSRWPAPRTASPRCRWTSRSPASPRRSCGSPSKQAHKGRLHILGEMAKSLTGARAELGEHAPRIETIKIPTDKIREVIGSGGSVIREIVAESGAKIDIDDDGTVKIAAAKREIDRGGAEPHQGDHVGARGRPDLQGQGRQDHGVRRLRELLRRQGRPRPYLAADRRAVRRPSARWSRKARKSTSSSWASTIAARFACR